MRIKLLNELFVFGDLEKPDFLLDLYDSILKEDEKFHFIDEIGYGGYLLIRYSPRFEKRIKQYCAPIDKYKFIFNGKWNEDSTLVYKYYESFAELYHAYSIFLLKNHRNLKLEKESIFRDRLFHLLYNMMRYLGLAGKNEMNYFTSIAIDRAYTWGYVEGMKDKADK